MRKFYFNTGVRVGSFNPPVKLGKGEILSPNGIKLIPFSCEDVPSNAIFMFACSNPKLKESEISTVIVRKIYNSSLCSEYAYFNCPV